MSMSDSPKGVAPPEPFTRLPVLPAGWQALAHNVLEDGTLAVIATDVDLAGEHRRIRAAILNSTSPDPPSRVAALAASGTARISIATPSGWMDCLTFPLEMPFKCFDRFSDGRWLIVPARNNGEANARIISSDGLVLDRIMLGDGIEHVAVDAADRIWVGWFDEGIFGNNNWRVAGQDWPPPGNGVACFTSDGALMPLPEWPDCGGTIADCYALNVSGAGAWACPYTDFPLVRFLTDEPTRWWRSNFGGPKAIAIDGSHALFAGGYREEANRLTLVALDGEGNGEDVQLLGNWTLPLRRLPPPSQEWMPVYDHPTLLAGRGDRLHLVDNGNWYCWRVADFLAELA